MEPSKGSILLRMVTLGFLEFCKVLTCPRAVIGNLQIFATRGNERGRGGDHV